MKQVQLGNSGVNVSSICLGCAHLATRTEESIASQILDDYFDAGGGFLDTANSYAWWHANTTGGESEAFLGRWMVQRKNRDRLFIATKVGANRADTSEFTSDHKIEGLSAKVILREAEASLKRLGTDRIDLYYAHVDDRSTPLEETLQALDQLVRSGKVRHVGCCNSRSWRLERAKQISRKNRWAEYCCIQQRHTYLRPKPYAHFGRQVVADEDLTDYCMENPDVRLLAYSPLLEGAYTRADRPLPEQYRTTENQERLAVLKQVAEEAVATANQLILAWMMQGKPVVIPIFAASNRAQIKENLGALDISLSEEQLSRLDNAGASAKS